MGDNVKNKLYKVLVFVFYALSLLLLLFYFKTDIQMLRFELLLVLLSCLFIYISGYILVRKLNCSKKILKLNLILYFIIYTILVIMLTLFDELFGRNGIIIIDWTEEIFNIYMKHYFNIIPFNTINLFIKGYIDGYISFRSFVINIFGNIFVLMPYGLFIPLIFSYINKYYKFLILIIFIVIIIEVLQFITLSGSCDIDDLILNLFGASITYFMFKINIINKIIRRIFLYE